MVELFEQGEQAQSASAEHVKIFGEGERGLGIGEEIPFVSAAFAVIFPEWVAVLVVVVAGAVDDGANDKDTFWGELVFVFRIFGKALDGVFVAHAAEPILD